jgi:GNAT superfamily N-acetyltransferase
MTLGIVVSEGKTMIRAAKKEDIPYIYSLIQELAEFEKLSHEFKGNIQDLENHIFGEKPFLYALVAELGGKIVGYALYFYNYSTFLTKPGVYLEDLYVKPNCRKQGIGKKLLLELGTIAENIGAGRIEWSVLDWNESAIEFYKSMGAQILPDWRICRVAGIDLENFQAKSKAVAMRKII